MPNLSLKEIKSRLQSLPEGEPYYIKVRHPNAAGGGFFVIHRLGGDSYQIYLQDAHFQGRQYIPQGARSAGPIFTGPLDGAMALISKYRRR